MPFDPSLLEPVEAESKGFDPSLLEPVEEPKAEPVPVAAAAVKPELTMPERRKLRELKLRQAELPEATTRAGLPRRAAEAVWGVANQPVIEVWPGGGMALGHEFRNEDVMKELERIATSGTDMEKIGIGLRAGGEQFLSSLATPIVGLGLVTKGKRLAQLSAGAFGALTGKGVIESFKRLGEEYAKPPSERKQDVIATLWTEIGLGAPMAGAMGAHAIAPSKAPLVTPPGEKTVEWKKPAALPGNVLGWERVKQTARNLFGAPEGLPRPVEESAPPVAPPTHAQPQKKDVTEPVNLVLEGEEGGKRIWESAQQQSEEVKKLAYEAAQNPTVENERALREAIAKQNAPELPGMPQKPQLKSSGDYSPAEIAKMDADTFDEFHKMLGSRRSEFLSKIGEDYPNDVLSKMAEDAEMNGELAEMNNDPAYAESYRKRAQFFRDAVTIKQEGGLPTEEAKYLKEEAEAIGTDYDLVPEPPPKPPKPGEEEDPFALSRNATSRVMQPNSRTGRIKIFADRYNRWTQWMKDSQRMDPDEVRNAVRSMLGEEQIHLSVKDQHALDYWGKLSKLERWINEKRYLGEEKRDPRVITDTMMGHEALRFQIQRINKMTPTEFAQTVGRERWTLQGLTALEDVVRTVRQGLTSAGGEQRAILDRVLANISAGKQALRGQEEPGGLSREEMGRELDKKREFEIRSKIVDTLDQLSAEIQDAGVAKGEYDQIADFIGMIGSERDAARKQDMIERIMPISGLDKPTILDFSERLQELENQLLKLEEIQYKNYLSRLSDEQSFPAGRSREPKDHPELPIDWKEQKFRDFIKSARAANAGDEKSPAKLKADAELYQQATEDKPRPGDEPYGLSKQPRRQRVKPLTFLGKKAVEYHKQMLEKLGIERLERPGTKPEMPKEVADALAKLMPKTENVPIHEVVKAYIQKPVVSPAERPNFKDFVRQVKQLHQYRNIQPAQLWEAWSDAVDRMIMPARGEALEKWRKVLNLEGEPASQFKRRIGYGTGKVADIDFRDYPLEVEGEIVPGEGAKKAMALVEMNRKAKAERYTALADKTEELAKVAPEKFDPENPKRPTQAQLMRIVRQLRARAFTESKGIPVRGAKSREYTEAEKMARSYQRTRAKLQMAIRIKLNKEAFSDRPDLHRETIGTEELDFNPKSEYGPYYEFPSQLHDNPEAIARVMLDHARASSTDNESVTKRLLVVQEKSTGKVHLVSGYNDAGTLKVMSPAGSLHTVLDSFFLRHYRPIASVLIENPVQGFKKTFGSLLEYGEQFGKEAKNRSSAAGDPADWAGEFAGLRGTKSKAVIPGGAWGEGGMFVGPESYIARESIESGGRGSVYSSGEPLTSGEVMQLVDGLFTEVGRLDNPADVGRYMNALRDRVKLVREEALRRKFPELEREEYARKIQEKDPEKPKHVVEEEVRRRFPDEGTVKGVRRFPQGTLKGIHGSGIEERTAINALRKMYDNLQEKNPKLADDEVMLLLWKKIYENAQSADSYQEMVQNFLSDLGEKVPGTVAAGQIPIPPATAPEKGVQRELTMRERVPPTVVRPEQVPPGSIEPLQQDAHVMAQKQMANAERYLQEAIQMGEQISAQPIGEAEMYPTTAEKVKARGEARLGEQAFSKGLSPEEYKKVAGKLVVVRAKGGEELIRKWVGPTGEPWKFGRGEVSYLPLERRSEPGGRSRERLEGQIAKNKAQARAWVFRMQTEHEIAALRDSVDTVANNLGRQAENHIRLVTGTGKAPAGDKQVLAASRAMIQAGVWEPKYKLSQEAQKAYDELLEADPEHQKAMEAMGSNDPRVVEAARAKDNAVRGKIIRELLKTGLIDHTGVEYRFREDRKPMLEWFDKLVNQGIGKAEELKKSINPLDRRKGNKWLESALKLKKELEYARVHWNDESLRQTSLAARQEMDRQYDREVDSGYQVRYDDDYLPGRYDAEFFNDNSVVFGRRILGQKFAARKTFHTYYDAIAEDAYLPVSSDVADMVGHRVRQGQRAINRTLWLESLKAMKDFDTGDKIAQDCVYVGKGEWKPPNATYEKMQAPWMKRPIAIKMGYKKLFKQMTDASFVHDWAPSAFALEMGQRLKHVILIGDFFHLGRVTYYGGAILGKRYLEGGRFGYKGGLAALEFRESDLDAAVSKGLIRKSAADWARGKVKVKVGGQDAEMSRIEISDRFQKKHGLNVGRIQDALYMDLVRNIPWIGTYNKFLFDKYTRGLMMESAVSEFERIHKQRPGIDRDVLMKDIANDINKFFGSIGRQGWIKSAGFQDLARIMFLAPQWVEGLVMKEAGFMRRLGPTRVGARTGLPKMGVLGRGMGRGLVASLALTQVLNLIFNRKPTWQNDDPEHKLDARIPDWTGKTDGLYMSPLAIYFELLHDIIRYMETKPKGWDVVNQIAQNKLGPWGRAALVGITGETPTGAKLTTTWSVEKEMAKAMMPTPISFGKAARAIGHAALPTMIAAPRPGETQRQLTAATGIKMEPGKSPGQRIGDLAKKWLEKEDLTKETGFELVPTDEPSYAKMRGALRNGDMPAAKDMLKLLLRGRSVKDVDQAMKTWANRAFTGSRKFEPYFMDSLNEKEFLLYQRAIEEKFDVYNKFIDLAISLE